LKILVIGNDSLRRLQSDEYESVSIQVCVRKYRQLPTCARSDAASRVISELAYNYPRIGNK